MIGNQPNITPEIMVDSQPTNSVDPTVFNSMNVLLALTEFKPATSEIITDNTEAVERMKKFVDIFKVKNNKKQEIPNSSNVEHTIPSNLLVGLETKSGEILDNSHTTNVNIERLLSNNKVKVVNIEPVETSLIEEESVEDQPTKCVRFEEGKQKVLVLPSDTTKVLVIPDSTPVGNTRCFTLSAARSNPVHILAININALYRLEREMLSRDKDKLDILQVIQKFAVRHTIVFYAGGRKSQKQHLKLLVKLQMRGVTLLAVDGQEVSIFESYGVTHIVDTRYKALGKLLTFRKYLRRCFLIVNTPNQLVSDPSEHINIVTNWVDLIPKLISSDPLVQFDSTNCSECVDTDCSGTCWHDERQYSQPLSSLFTAVIEDTQQDTTRAAYHTSIISWNVRSIRKCFHSARFASFLKTCDADIIFLQETCAPTSLIMSLPGFTQLLKNLGFNYCYWFSNDNVSSQAGTALISRLRPKQVLKGFVSTTEQAAQDIDHEGRVISAIYGSVLFVAAYVPTLSFDEKMTIQKTERRQKFQQQFLLHLDQLTSRYPDKQLIVCGDLNTTSDDIDIDHYNKTRKGLPLNMPSTTKLERDFLEQMCSQFKLDDVALDKMVGDRQTTFNGNFPLLPGLQMRIDFFLIPKLILTGKNENIQVEQFEVLRDVLGSDHFPIKMTLALSFKETNSFCEPSRVTDYVALGEQRKLIPTDEKDNGLRNVDPNLMISVTEPTKHCWSTFKPRFVCSNPENCQYSHTCPCGNKECRGCCPAAETFRKSFRKSKVKKWKRANEHFPTQTGCNGPPEDLAALAEGFASIHLLNQPISALSDETLLSKIKSSLFEIAGRTLPDNFGVSEPIFNTDTSTTDIVDTPDMVDTSDNIAKDVDQKHNVDNISVDDLTGKDIEPVVETHQHSDHIEQTQDSVSTTETQNQNVHDHQIDDWVTTVEKDPDNFEITDDLLKLCISAIDKVRKLTGETVYSDVKSIPVQKKDVIWQTINTAYYIHRFCGDANQQFTFQPRHALSESLTDEDMKEISAHFIDVRNLFDACKQLKIDEKEVDILVKKLIGELVDDDQTNNAEQNKEECRENDDIADLRSATTKRKVFCPHVMSTFEGLIQEAIRVLCDSGATYSIVSTKFLNQLLSQEEIKAQSIPTNVRLRIANGEITSRLSKIKLQFKIGNRQLNDEFFIMDTDSYNIILGCSFFEKYDAVLRFRERTLSIGLPVKTTDTDDTGENCEEAEEAEIVKFMMAKQDIWKQPNHLFSTESMIIDPKSEAVIELELKGQPKTDFAGKFGEIWPANTLMSKTSILGASGYTYIRDNGKQNYTLINPTDAPIVIPKGMIVGQYYNTPPEWYGTCYKFDTENAETDDIPGKMDIDTQASVNTHTNHMDIEECTTHAMGEEKVEERMELPPVIGEDYSDRKGYREIKPASLIDDFSEHQLKQMFAKMGLSDLTIGPHKDLPGEDECSLPPHLLNKFSQVLAKREAVFSKNNAWPKPIKHYSTNIPWFGEPKQSKLRPYSPEMIDIYRKEIGPFIASGVLVPSKAPWRSAVMLVLKPDGKSWRMVSDFRIANKQVKKRNWPLPRVDAVMSAVGQAKFFSSVDQNNCYFQIPLSDERSKSWATIQTPTGVFSYTRCPQGYVNSQADLMRFMDLYVTAGLSWKTCLAYCDDCLIWSDTAEQHIEDIDEILCRFEYFGVQLKAKKCEFFTPKLIFLGYEISRNGIRPNPAKVKAIVEQPLPSTSKELKGFIAKVGYYRRNCGSVGKSLAQTIVPLTDLTSKDVSWPHKYTEEEKKAFEDTKYLLTSETSILATRDIQYKLAVDADSCNRGLGAILMQLSKPERPLMYASRKLTAPERLYTAYALEVLAAVYGISVFRPWIIFEEFLLRIDCIALKWLMTTDVSSMFVRWVIMLCEYRFKIMHRPGKLALHADYLSRNPIGETGDYGEKPIENLYHPKTTPRNLLEEAEKAVKKQIQGDTQKEYLSRLQQCRTSDKNQDIISGVEEKTAKLHDLLSVAQSICKEQSLRVALPVNNVQPVINLKTIDIIRTEGKTYIEVITDKHRTIYTVDKHNILYIHLKENIIEVPIETVPSETDPPLCTRLDLLNYLGDSSQTLTEELYLGSNEQKTPTPKLKSLRPVVVPMNTEIVNVCNASWPSIQPINTYNDTPWDCLTSNEQSLVTQQEVLNINENSPFIHIKHIPGNGFGVFAKLFIQAHTCIGYYKGQELTAEQVEQTYPAGDQPIYLFMGNKNLFFDACDPRQANFTRFINAPGVKERPNIKVVFNTRSSKLMLTTVKIIVPGEQLCIPYGPSYHILGKRLPTGNQQIRNTFNLRGQPNTTVTQRNEQLQRDQQSQREIIDLTQILHEHKDVDNVISSPNPSTWVPTSLRHGKRKLYHSDGSEVSDTELSKEVRVRAKLLTYQKLIQQRPDLFQDPQMTDEIYAVDKEKEIIAQDQQDDIIMKEIITIDSSVHITPQKPHANHPHLTYYFPEIPVEQIQMLSSDNTLDNQIKMIETALFGDGEEQIFKEWLKSDSKAQKIISILLNQKPKEVTEKLSSWTHKNYCFKDGVLWKKNIVIPKKHGINTQPYSELSKYIPALQKPNKVDALRVTIMRYFHGTIRAMHPSTREMYHRIRSSYFWPKLFHDCQQWVKACDMCANRNTPRPNKYGLYYPVTYADWPFRFAQLDFIKGLPWCNGYNAVCIIICLMTRYPFAIPCCEETILNASNAMKEVMAFLPFQIQTIVTDRSSTFTSNVFKQLTKDFDINIKHSSTASPLGIVENFNKYFIANLSLLLLQPERRNNWTSYIAPILFCWRSSSTNNGYSPFKMLFNVDPPNPIDFVLQRKGLQTEEKQNQSTFHAELQQIYTNVRKISARNAILQAIYKNTTLKEVQYQKNDLVRVWKRGIPDKFDAYFVFARIIEHKPGSGSARVQIFNRGKWINDTARIRNIAPVTPYSTEYITTAPMKYSVSKIPPKIDETTNIQKKTVKQPTKVQQSPSVQVGIGKFVIIDAQHWDDVFRDNLQYTVAKCLEIYIENNIQYGIFQRYGNTRLQNTNQKLYPGVIDHKDNKYSFPKKQGNRRCYTNALQSYGIPLKPIRLDDISITFDKLTKTTMLPSSVIDLLHQRFPKE